MRPLRTLSPSTMELHLRQHVKRTSSKKRKLFQIIKSDTEKENINSENANGNSDDTLINIQHNLPIQAVKSESLGENDFNIPRNNRHRERSCKRISTRRKLFESIILHTKGINYEKEFDELNSPPQRKLRRLSYCNQVTESINNELFSSDMTCKRRRFSLQHIYYTPTYEKYNNEISDTKILPLNSENLKLFEKNKGNNFRDFYKFKKSTLDDPDVPNVWCKYTTHKKLEKMDSTGSCSSSSNSALSSISIDTSLSRSKSTGFSLSNSCSTSDISCSESDVTISQKSLKIRQLKTKVRNSFKELQRISSLKKNKLPVSRSKSDPTHNKSSFKSYIYSDTLSPSISTPSLPNLAAYQTQSSSIYKNLRPSLHDIFNSYPELADNFAIMFPNEPRPEWHQSLKVVIQKAGKKLIGKPPEQQQDTIPDHLKYQLKQIYVY